MAYPFQIDRKDQNIPVVTDSWTKDFDQVNSSYMAQGSQVPDAVIIIGAMRCSFTVKYTGFSAGIEERFKG